MLFVTDTTSLLVLFVYIPVAALIVSPDDALPIAPLIVAQVVAGLKQSLLSLPLGATYHGPAARVGR